MTESKGKTILCVEDEIELRDAMSSTLTVKGYSVETAVNGKHALQKLQSGATFDLILCDWKMPMMTGIELLKEVRKSKKFGKVPFIMVTAQGDKANVIQALKTGVNDYVVKPFKEDELLMKIQTQLERAAS